MIWASMASVSSRYSQREQALRSLHPQVSTITWHHGDEMGDRMKFMDATKAKHYYFSCDDDLIYPPDYCEKMISKLKEYDNQIIVTCMGRVVHDKVKSYYKTQDITKYSCLTGLENDEWVHIGGTGVMAFHVDYFRPDYSKFKNGFMADIWLALQAQEKKIPILCMAHEPKWLLPLDTDDAGIHGIYRDNDKTQADAVNSINWILYEKEKS